MALPESIRTFLTKASIPYAHLEHDEVYTCIEEARAIGVHADEVGKNLAIKDKESIFLLLLPGNHRIDMRKLRRELSSHARLLTEDEIAQRFPDFAVGAIPPFKGLIDATVLADRSLLAHAELVFLGGTHRDSVRVRVADLLNVNEARIVDVIEATE